jgi:hypothetical protein
MVMLPRLLSLVLVAAVAKAVAKAAAAERRPPHATNVTMYNLRPATYAQDLRDKDSADAAGDIFFYIADRLVAPYGCRHSGGHEWFCSGMATMLEHDQVYSQIVVEVDGRFGGCPSGANNCSAYRDCNPDPSDPTGVKWRCGFGDACPYKPAPPPPPPFARQQLPAAAAAARPRSRPVRLAALRRGEDSPPPYWRCSEFVEQSPCRHHRSGGGSCEACVANQSGLPSECSAELIAHACSASFDGCHDFVQSSGCRSATGHNGAQCEACVVEHSAGAMAANCTERYVGYACGFGQHSDGACNVTGKVDVNSRYCEHSVFDPGAQCSCVDSCDGPWGTWKAYAAAITGGYWYSTLSDGDCTDANASACTWLVMETKKTVNASCVNQAIHRAVEAHGKDCFAACPPSPPTNVTDCWTLCFYETLMGRTPLPPYSKIAGALPMTSEQLTGPFLDAFEKSDPSEGGCPDLGPDFAQASATAAVGAGAGATIAAGSQNSAKERRVAATVN